jgi:hypothetical protein
VDSLAGRGSVLGGKPVGVKFSKYILTRAYAYTLQGTRTRYGINFSKFLAWRWLVCGCGWSAACS